MFNKLISLKREIVLDFDMGPFGTTKEGKTSPMLEFPVPEEIWGEVKDSYIPEKMVEERPLTLEKWMAEFKVGSSVKTDTDTEQAMEELKKETEKKYKELVIKNSQKYCRLNHTTKTL